MSSARWVWLCVVLLVMLASLPVSYGALLGFRQAVPGYKLTFPADHAAHPDYRTEWWYYTGHLRTPTGKRYGYQLTFFRHRVDSNGLAINPSKWFADNVYMAHMAITDETAKRFVYGEKLNRAALGLAGAAEQRYHVWNEDWLAERLGTVQHLVGEIPGYKLNLIVTPLKPPVLHGVAQAGLSQKGEGTGHASYYYSLTRLKTEGVLHTSEGVLRSRASVGWITSLAAHSSPSRRWAGTGSAYNWPITTSSCCITCVIKMAASTRIPAAP